MAFRTPRGYAVNRVPYQELSEGVRPEARAVPTEAWTGLPPVRVDEHHHDPIVIDAGTIVGIASGGTASGAMFPAHAVTGSIHLASTSDDHTNWGLTDQGTSTAVSLTNGPVAPLGIAYQPIYSFQLQNTFTNYKRNDNAGFVTDYLIQVPAITTREHDIQVGDLVAVTAAGGDGAVPSALDDSTHVDAEYGRVGSLLTSADNLIGRFQAYDPADDSGARMRFVVGRCLSVVSFASGSASTLYSSDTSNVSLTTAGQSEFKGLDKVQTVPGLGVAGSGTKGVPGWLRAARSDAAGNYVFLNILVRL